MRQHSIPALAEIPASANLAEVVFKRAAERPRDVILRRKAVHGPGGAAAWQDVTAGGFHDEVTALARGLIASGVGVGDRVALMSRTRYEWTVLDYAIWAAGAVSVPIYETSSAEQVEWILTDSGATAVIVETAAEEEIVAGLRDRVPAVGNVWRIEAPGPGEPGASGSPGAAGLEALTASGASISGEVVKQRASAATASDLATIIYTSGTTGRPKGCMITHGNMLADVRNVASDAPEIFAMPGGSTLLFLPLAHVLARIIEVGCLESGIVLGHTPDIKNLLPDLATFRPTFLLAVPRVFEKVYNSAEQKAEAEGKGAIFRRAAGTAIRYSRALDSQAAGGRGPSAGLRVAHALFDRLVYAKLRAAIGGQVRYAVSGGAALGERLGHFFRGIGITILEGYGLTETTAAATVNRPSRNKIGTVGLPLPGVTVGIADDGEILMKGPNVFPGYWQADTATAEMFTDDGWLRTGDIGELDDDGFLRVTGRKKEIIVTAGGKNVAPAVLEDRLRAHWLVSQCMVVGDGKPYVAALVTLDEESLPQWKDKHGKPASATASDLRDDPDLLAEIQSAVDEANQAVSRAESIRRFRVLGTDFTQEGGQLTPSLKVRRNVVAKEFASDIEALYS
ncbi:MAG TPA: long-chain fatty acid--CoA ligase [Streptosporangiaceae bacterium]|nr:long-chain fatty acid--CoA ligase [Streptosporangiaceae bacterium]